MTIAVVDSGCDGKHPDLAGQLVPGAGFIGVPGDNGGADVSGDSHGTSIAAVIAGTGRNPAADGVVGLAPKAKVQPVRISTGDRIEPVALAKGIIYAADHGARVINISVVTPEPDPNLRAAVDHAVQKGAVVVAAAGNTSQTGTAVGYPASFPGVVAVSAVDVDKRFWRGSASGPRVALAAPGVGIRSANDHGGYLRSDGTSLAVPYVAAAAALVWS
ncbi:S8 family serine peptidase [Amycolatopsis sp. NPDC004079]|uniref:S8 family serine peptidase n=1 Tax=Amycolatopsis sp. NPDC004079 TaxID=3154549 RepID=UPI0033B3FF08